MAIHGHHRCPQTVCTTCLVRMWALKSQNTRERERWWETACTNSLQLPGRHSRRLNQNTKATPKAPKCGTGGTLSLPHGCRKIFKTGFNLSPQTDTVLWQKNTSQANSSPELSSFYPKQLFHGRLEKIARIKSFTNHYFVATSQTTC